MEQIAIFEKGSRYREVVEYSSGDVQVEQGIISGSDGSRVCREFAFSDRSFADEVYQAHVDGFALITPFSFTS